MVTRKTVGTAIMKRRQALKLSQEDLAGEAELTREYISKVENGHVNFSIDVFLQLAKALKIDPAKLLN